MGAVKEWVFSEKVCIVCGKTFTPAEVLGEVPYMDLGAPTCSKECYGEYIGVMEAVSEMQEEAE